MGEKSDFAPLKVKQVSGETIKLSHCMSKFKGAWLQENLALVNWVNRQPLAAVVNCLGDGHDGVWNLISGIAPTEHRRYILDWT